MTCTCKAELAAAMKTEAFSLRLDAGPYGTFRWERDRAIADTLDRLADRLCPQAEPLDGWRAKCEIGNQSNTDWWIRFTSDDGLYLWYHHTTGWVGEPHQLRQPCFPTESAARAALLAASEPGVPAKEPKAEGLHPDADVCTVCQGTGWVVDQGPDAIPDSCPKCQEPPSPAPAVAFDADAVAKKMVHWNSVRKLWSLWQPNGEVCVCHLMPGSDDEKPGANELSAIKHIASALRAAESAGYARAKAEQTQPAAPAAAKEGT